MHQQRSAAHFPAGACPLFVGSCVPLQRFVAGLFFGVAGFFFGLMDDDAARFLLEAAGCSCSGVAAP